jgi:uncharacterized protein (DUF433 family)
VVKDDATLIAENVEENPRFPGAADAWLRESGVPIWAIVGYFRGAAQGNIQQTAEDYEIPVDAVHAALAYYHKYPRPIDQRIEDNAA